MTPCAESLRRGCWSVPKLTTLTALHRTSRELQSDRGVTERVKTMGSGYNYRERQQSMELVKMAERGQGAGEILADSMGRMCPGQ